MNNISKMITVAAAMMAASAANAGITNGGFENGLTGWTASGNVGTAASTAPNGGTTMGRVTGSSAGVYQTIGQLITVGAGAKLSFDALWAGNDYMPYDDDGFVRLGDVTLWDASVTEFGNYGNSGWQSISYEILTAGTYLLQIGARNAIDGAGSPAVFADNFAVAEQVPEPGALALLGLGVLGLAASRRRRV